MCCKYDKGKVRLQPWIKKIVSVENRWNTGVVCNMISDWQSLIDHPNVGGLSYPSLVVISVEKRVKVGSKRKQNWAVQMLLSDICDNTKITFEQVKMQLDALPDYCNFQ